ncbi:hypothetical protein BACPU_23500 [Bacillus pumilus]|nr:hypothetical protein BACPU_23500 [Bacillus pumilus]
MVPYSIKKRDAIEKTFYDLNQSEVDQLWAEAKYYYDRGDKTILIQKESIELASAIQERHREDNGLKGRIETFIDIPIPKNWYALSDGEKRRYYEEKKYAEPNGSLIRREKICSLEVWHECLLNNNNMSKKQSTEINHILRQMSYLRETSTIFGSYGQQRGFIVKK